MRSCAASILLLSLLLTNAPAADLRIAAYSYSYSYSFHNSDNEALVELGDAGINQGAFQLTPDSPNTFLFYKTGRILFNKPFNFWEQQHQLPRGTTNSSFTATANRVASFNTSFTINIYHPKFTMPGEGFAFVLAPSLDPPPPGSKGGYLGLTNETLDGLPSNHFVAVEFDTSRQSYDPDSNHVGLDINSVRSTLTASLTPLGIDIAPVDPANYTVWIQYDGGAKHIWVYMAREGQPKPVNTVLNASLDLSNYLLPKSYFGFAWSTGVNSELNRVLAWNLTIEVLPEGHGMPAWKLALAISLPLAAVMLALGIILWRYIKRRSSGVDLSMLEGTLKSVAGMPREFKFKDLKKATNNFDEKNKLGQGGFGLVYKGVLPVKNTEVAVKKFSRDNTKRQGDFLSELSITNRLRHKHLVRLVGWCHKKNVLMLVYDYMSNGSLDQHLFCGPDKPLLSWERRYNILAGVASAIHYIHNEYDQKVVHRDVKASNIMLDVAFNARLGDFGLARTIETNKTSYEELELSGVPGTLGYVAPECFHTGKATCESDVFSFGAVVLEVVCGRRPHCDIAGFRFLADWVWRLHREGRILDAVDPRLGDAYIAEEAQRLLMMALACSHPIPEERPKMEAIVQIISGSVGPPNMPPFKPAFMWPSYVLDDDQHTDGAVTSTSMVVTPL